MKPIHMLGAAAGALLVGGWLAYGIFGEDDGAWRMRDWLLGGGAGFALGALVLAGLRSPSRPRLAFYSFAGAGIGVLLVAALAGDMPALLASVVTVTALLLYAPVLREVRHEAPSAAA